MKNWIWCLVLVLNFAALGCNEANVTACTPGEENCGCTEEGQCLPGLSCLSETCVATGMPDLDSPDTVAQDTMTADTSMPDIAMDVAEDTAVVDVEADSTADMRADMPADMTADMPADTTDVMSCQLTDCAGTCVDTDSTVAHCGACNNDCAAVSGVDPGATTCTNGSCVFICSAGRLDCDMDPDCEIAGDTDPLNCGACGVQCGQGETCVGGQCSCGAATATGPACSNGDVCCADACVPISDPSCMCGAAANCASDQLCCNDACADYLTDDANCGACGVTCMGDEVCSSGGCSCPASTPNSCPSNTCVDLATDDSNCGSCGNLCDTATESCSNGSCECNGTLGDCDSNAPGCETDLTSSDAHCGACNMACSADQVCVGSTCVCDNLYVVSATPASGAASVPTANTPIDIEFSCDIDPTTVNGATFRVFSEYTGLLAGTYSVPAGTPRTIRFEPAVALWPGDRIQVTATSQIASTNGVNPTRGWVGGFFAATLTGGSSTFDFLERQVFDPDSFGADIGDINDDGHLDLYLGRGLFPSGGTPDYIWLNQNVASPRFGGSSTLGNLDTRYVILGDFNADGLIDVAAAHRSAASGVYFNTSGSAGSFAAIVPVGNAQWSEEIAVGDLDGDGDLDLVVANLTNGAGLEGNNYIYMNNGNGTFASGVAIGSEQGTFALAVADLDNDGDLDIVLGEDTGNDTVWLNDGFGSYTQGNDLPSSSGNTFALAVGDLNGDNFVDIVVGRAEEPSRVYINDGMGSFSAGSSVLGDTTVGVALGDLEGDGDLDVFFTQSSTVQEHRLGINNGSGGLTIPADSMIDKWDEANAYGDTFGIALGDLDGDGDLDALTADRNMDPAFWWENRAH